jgi:integrase
MNPVTDELLAAWRLPEWTVSLQATGRSPGTVDRYAYHVRTFARAHPDPAAVTVADVEGRLAGCRAPEYGRAVRVALHAWYLWAQREGLAVGDPTAPIAPIRIPRARARPCPEPVYKQARIGSDPDTRLMVELAAQAGLRRSEIAAVRGADLDGPWLAVVGKGGVQREVAVNDRLRAAIEARGEGWTFPSARSGTGHLTADAVGRRISRALGPGWSAHTLRHRAATVGYAATGDLIAVQHQLGHASVATTQRYVRPDRDRQRAVAAACG